MSHRIDPTALSYWFPRIRDAGLPVPDTKILDMPQEAQEAIFAALFDGKDAGDIMPFVHRVRGACSLVGYPAFLRTDHTSGKHGWTDTCFVSSPDDVVEHIAAIVEYSEINGMFGELPWQRWVVREMLPTIPLGVCPQYGDMPVCREFRYFVDGGSVICHHPYWPAEALIQGGADGIDIDELNYLSDSDAVALSEIAEKAGNILGGSWSVDLLETKRGWFLTDMAEAHKSWHWPGCSSGQRGER